MAVVPAERVEMATVEVAVTLGTVGVVTVEVAFFPACQRVHVESDIFSRGGAGCLERTL